MSKSDSRFEEALKTKKIPILTIDKKFHDLTDAVNASEAMKNYVSDLNELLKMQGKANNDIKEIKKLKKQLMQEIVENTDVNSELSESEKEKKAADNTRLIEECNEKIENCEDELLDIPKKIDDVNRDLMKELMSYCYDVMKNNEKQIDEIARWITQVRIELKKQLVRKTDMETSNQKIYEYMHDIFGAEVIDIFDMTYKDTRIK